MAKATIRSVLLVLVAIFVMAVYVSIQLYYRSERLDLIASLQADNSNMISKIAFLENNDWALAIQQLPKRIQDEIACLSERIKQDKKSRITN